MGKGIRKNIVGFNLSNKPDEKAYIEIWFKDLDTGKQEVCTIYDLYVDPVEDILNQE